MNLGLNFQYMSFRGTHLNHSRHHEKTSTQLKEQAWATWVGAVLQGGTIQTTSSSNALPCGNCSGKGACHEV